jgi:hypothetical protein
MLAIRIKIFQKQFLAEMVFYKIDSRPRRPPRLPPGSLPGLPELRPEPCPVRPEPGVRRRRRGRRRSQPGGIRTLSQPSLLRPLHWPISGIYTKHDFGCPTQNSVGQQKIERLLFFVVRPNFASDDTIFLRRPT